MQSISHWGMVRDLAYDRGVEDAIKVIEERGKHIAGAIQPDLTVKLIRKRLLESNQG